MFKRWNKIDLVVVALTALTPLFYFIFSRSLFKFYAWTLAIFILIRILVVVRRKFFWKIRNRLFFSSVFLVITPIFFITIFFIFILNLVVAQYGVVIIDNIFSDRLSHIDEFAQNLRNLDPHSGILNLAQSVKISPDFIIVLWEKENQNKYMTFLKNPEDFDETNIPLIDFKGFFISRAKLYQGVIIKRGNRGILLAMEINQEYLDKLTSISEFKIKYRFPGERIIKGNGESPEPVDTEDVIIFPYLYEYRYLDFDNLKNSRPFEKNADFLISSDSVKIFGKINGAISSSPQGTTKKFLYALIVMFGTFIIVSFLIGFRNIRVITRSIDQLTRGTHRIRNGDFSFRIRTRSGDQMQYLAECFNEMAAGIDRLLLDEKEKHRLEEELRIARSIQLKLLPPESLITDEFEIAAVNIPAEEIAGDYFDYFYKQGNYLSLLVADVSGKGASAAFYMAELKGVINHLHRMILSPAALISECHFSLKDTFDRVTFITMNMAHFHIPGKKFVLARAGHTPAIYFNALEKKCIELHPGGIAIGLGNFSRGKLDEVEMSYNPGDILILFSDGLTEIMNESEEMLGINQLKQIILRNHHLSAAEIKKIILDFSIEFSGTDVKRDDLTFILLKVKS